MSEFDDGKFIYLLSWRQPGFEMMMKSYLPADSEDEAILKATQHFGIGFDTESATAVLVKER